MQSDTFDFPQYRKYTGIETYYKIESNDSFIELMKIGSSLKEHHVQANQYPEMLRIKDMLVCLDQRWEVISEETYLGFKKE